MNNTFWIGIIVIALVAAGGGWWYATNNGMAPVDSVQENMEEVGAGEENAAPQEDTVGTGGSAVITLAVVATHNSAESCWSIINGEVYDLTSWIAQHPGGPQAIQQLCGTDGSAQFNAQHGGRAQQAQVLANFKVGTLAQ